DLEIENLPRDRRTARPYFYLAHLVPHAGRAGHPVLGAYPPLHAQLRKIGEIILILHRQTDGLAGSGQVNRAFLELYRGVEFLGNPEFRLSASPAIDHAPGSISDETPAREPILVLNEMTAGSAAAILQSAIGHAEDIVGPRPNLGAGDGPAAHHPLINGRQRFGVVVADARVQPHLGYVAEDPLKDAPALIPQNRFDRFLQLGDVR